jgi:hypothetical protein
MRTLGVRAGFAVPNGAQPERLKQDAGAPNSEPPPRERRSDK